MFRGFGPKLRFDPFQTFPHCASEQTSAKHVFDAELISVMAETSALATITDISSIRAYARHNGLTKDHLSISPLQELSTLTPSSLFATLDSLSDPPDCPALKSFASADFQLKIDRPSIDAPTAAFLSSITRPPLGAYIHLQHHLRISINVLNLNANNAKIDTSPFPYPSVLGTMTLNFWLFGNMSMISEQSSQIWQTSSCQRKTSTMMLTRVSIGRNSIWKSCQSKPGDGLGQRSLVLELMS